MSRVQQETRQAVGGVSRYREYGLLHSGDRWCVIHQGLDDIWHVVGIYSDRVAAQDMVERIYGPPASTRAPRPKRPPLQLDGQLDIFGNEVGR